MDRYRNFIYLKEYKFLFCYVPKVACTNWKCLFRKLIGFDNYLNAGIAHSRSDSGLIYLNDVDEPQAILQDNNVGKYCFTRDPYSRILSAYLNKVDRFNRKPQASSDDYFFKVYNSIKELMQLSGEITFLDFLSWLDIAREKRLFGHFDEHWRNQVEILCFDEISYDFIGRFENIQEHSDTFFNLINVDLEFPSQKDVGFPATKASDKMKRYYTEEAIEIVNKLYFEDFQKLGFYKIKKSVDVL